MIFICLLLSMSLASAATLKGSIYNSAFELEENVIVEIDTTPQQKYLSKDGTYNFDLQPGEYELTAKNDEFTVLETVKIISKDGEYIFDLFLLPDFIEEDELWQDTEEELDVDETTDRSLLPYIAAGIISLFTIFRLIRLRKKYANVLGRGTIEFLKSKNEKTLTYLRRYEDQILLIVNNLSRYTQPIELDLSEYNGFMPIEPFGNTNFPKIGELPYFITVGPHNFYWFKLEAVTQEAKAKLDELKNKK